MTEPTTTREWRQEPDRVPARSSIVLMLASAAIVLASVAGTWLFLRPWSSGHPLATEIRSVALRGVVPTGPAEIAGVRQTLLGLRREPERLARQRARLQSYGWVDADHTVVHMPIARAIELSLAGIGAPLPTADDPALAATGPTSTR